LRNPPPELGGTNLKSIALARYFQFGTRRRRRGAFSVVYSAASAAGGNLHGKRRPPFRSSGGPLVFVVRQNAAHARHLGESNEI
jgi:hypothetical protein